MMRAVDFGIMPVRAFCIFAFSLALTPSAAADSNGPPARSSVKTVVFEDKRIRESSGLARSFRNQNAIWTHNDSGDSARLFLVDLKTGRTLNTCKLDLGRPRDWEDMASFNMGERPMLVVGDVGSNRNGKRPRRLHFIDEPIFPADSNGKTLEVQTWATIEFQFEDGFPDCEAIGVDATSRSVFLISKSWGSSCGIYELDLPSHAGLSSQSARRLAKFNLAMVTAMDIHPDGKRMLILSYHSIWEFRRKDGQPWRDALAATPRIIRIPPLGSQVEGICYAGRDNLFHLSTEGRRTPIWTSRVPDVPKQPTKKE